MEVGNVAVVAQSATTRKEPRPQPAAGADGTKQAVDSSAPKSGATEAVKVSVSANRVQAAGVKGVNPEPKGAKGATSASEPPQPVAKERGSDVGDTRRAYDLENGDLVVSIVSGNEVIKQIPAEDQRKIKQAIEKYVSDTPQSGGAPVTATAQSAEESGPGEKGEKAEEPAKATVADLVT